MPQEYNALMNGATKKPSLFRRGLALIGWTRSSSVLLGGFLLMCGLIVYVWWPLAQEAMTYIDWKGAWWVEMDWLLVGIFAFMSLTIMARANLKRDALIVLVGMVGGLVIEAWGTQTNLWHYYTAERPPLWIIPAWPIASLSIDRITRGLNWGIKSILNTIPRKNTAGKVDTKYAKVFNDSSLKSLESLVTFAFKILYWLIFIAFFALMLYFVAPTFGKTYTVMALLLLCGTDLPGRSRAGLLPGVVGHDTRVLDVLHQSDAAILRSGGARDGGGGFLAGGVDGEMGMGEVDCAGEEEIETCA